MFEDWNKPGEGRVPEGPMLFFMLLIMAVLVGAVVGILGLIYKVVLWLI